MSVDLPLSACPPGTYAWLAARGGVEASRPVLYCAVAEGGSVPAVWRAS